LGHGPLDVGRISVGHGLNGDRRAAAGHDRAFAKADAHADGVAAGEGACVVGIDELGGGQKGGGYHAGLGLLKNAPTEQSSGVSRS